jgi:hypothetical protein
VGATNPAGTAESQNWQISFRSAGFVRDAENLAVTQSALRADLLSAKLSKPANQKTNLDKSDSQPSLRNSVG